MSNRVPKLALWALVVLLLAGSLTAIGGARALSTPNYTLLGYVYQAGGTPASAGVTVDLIQGGSHAVYVTQTTAGGQFKFNVSTTGNALAPGWWGLQVPPQAHVRLAGCSICGILPGAQGASWSYENSTQLTTNVPVKVFGIHQLPYLTTLFGNVSEPAGGGPVANANVALLAPTWDNFVLSNATTNATGGYEMTVPRGTWVLQTSTGGSPGQYNYTQATFTTRIQTQNVVMWNYIAWGFLTQSGSPGTPIPTGGNATIFDAANGLIQTTPILPGGFYAVGTYPANFVGPGGETFTVILSPVGYTTVSFPITVSTVNPTGGPNPHNVTVKPIPPQGVYRTVLDFTNGFSKVNVSTTVTLANDSTFSGLANSSVGQLWAQLGLDWQQGLSFSSANYPSVAQWIQSAGPFFPGGESSLTVNGTGFGNSTAFTFTNSTTCSGVCGLASSAGISLSYAQSYNSTTGIAAGSKTYTLAFNFQHPQGPNSINYTVKLPAGYVLSANSVAPSASRLAPAGLNGTWTNFTLVSQYSPTTAGSASFSLVKYGAVTANVNASLTTFTFSKLNVLNQTHGNYTVEVGTGENVTFSGLNSTFPSGTNGTLFTWNFGDGSKTVSASSPTNYHTYTTAGAYTNAWMRVVSSGGLTSNVTFHVLVGSTAPSAAIATNATLLSPINGVNYAIVNQSTTLHFNTTGSKSVVCTGCAPGVLSVAAWNISTGTTNWWIANYSAASVTTVAQNFTHVFTGAGHYITSGLVGGQAVAVTGWQFNISLTLWDYGGHKATASMVILVKDTEKPVPVINALDYRGKAIPTSGLVESANNQTAEVQLSAQNTTDPHNGSVVWYNWSVTNKGNSSINFTKSFNTASSGYKLPSRIAYWLHPQAKPYTVNLTVSDRAGNKAWTTSSVVISINTTTRPVLSVTNLTAPTTMTDGSSYTIWVNVTNTVGKNSTAMGTQVLFYILPPSGSGSQSPIAQRSSVQFFNYTNNGSAVANTPWATGSVNLPYNHTVRAVIHWTPARQGTYDIWANATASNEFLGTYSTGANQAHVQVTLNPNPITQYEIDGAIAAAVVAVIVIIVLIWRRRVGGPVKKPSTGKSGLERGGKKDEDDDEEDEES